MLARLDRASPCRSMAEKLVRKDSLDAHVAFAIAWGDNVCGPRKVEVGPRARNDKEAAAAGYIIDSVTSHQGRSQMDLEKALGFELTAVWMTFVYR